MSTMIEEYLKEAGFDDKEIIIYLEVLKRGKCLPAILSKATKINRATVYNILDKLRLKKLVDYDLFTKTKTVYGLSLDNFLLSVKKKKEEVIKEEVLTNNLINELRKMPKNFNFEIPKIRYIDGPNILDYLYDQQSKWIQSTLERKVEWWSFRDEYFVKNFESWVKNWYSSKISDHLKVNIISNKSKEETIFQRQYSKYLTNKRSIKYFENRSHIDSTFWVAGDYIIMIYSREKPNYLVEIYNPTFANNLREMIKELWFRI